MWHMLGVYMHASTQMHPILSWTTHIKSPIFRKTGFSFRCVKLSAGSLHLTAVDLLLVLSFAALQNVCTCKINSGYWDTTGAQI